MASAHLRRDHGLASLSTTELVHEAFLKLGPNDERRWDGRAHFFGAASRAMRQVLVDFARRRRARNVAGSSLASRSAMTMR